MAGGGVGSGQFLRTQRKGNNMKKLISVIATRASNILYKERVKTALFTRLTDEGVSPSIATRLSKSCVTTWSSLIAGRAPDVSPREMAQTVLVREVDNMVKQCIAAKERGDHRAAEVAGKKRDIYDNAMMRRHLW